MEILEPILREDVRKIWDGVPKPDKHKDTPLTEFFNVDVTALSNYEEKEEQFKLQVAELRERFQNSIAPGGLAGDRRGVVPATGFPFSTQEIWRVIKENKDLDLPAHKVMVATVRCEEIAHEKLKGLLDDEEWRSLEEKAKNDVVVGFGKFVNDVVEKFLQAYNMEAAFFDEGVRTSKQNFLTSRILDVVQPSYQLVIGHHRAKVLNSFKMSLDTNLESHSDEGFANIVRWCSKAALLEFERGCADAEVARSGWDSSKAKEKLLRDIDTHAQTKRKEKLAEVVSMFENKLEAALDEPTASLLDAAAPDTWSAISRLMEAEVKDATSRLSDAIVGFEPSKEEETKMRDFLSKFGRGVVEKKSKEEASQAIIRMKQRFINVFGHEADNMPRIWGEEHDVRAITRDARSSSLKLLSVLAAIRLDEDSQKSDSIESSLKPLLGDQPETALQRTISRTVSGNNTAIVRGQSSALHALSVAMWPGVSSNDTLITPVQCKSIWRQFQAETEYTISQAMAAQEAAKRNKSWLPPPWALMAMGVLGFNEFMALLRNPFYLVLIFIAYLVGKAVWVQLDITREFEHGFVPGLISVSTKLLPTVMTLLKKLADEGTQGAASAMNNNAVRTNGTDRIRHRELDDMSAGQGSVSSGLRDDEPQANGNLRQRHALG